MDILYDAAQAYSRLIGTKYSIVLGYKQRAINLILNFYKDNFYHLAGLHNFKDIDALSARPEAVYKKILSKNITYNDILKSSHFDEKYKIRILDLIELEKYLDIGTDFFGWDKRNAIQAKISTRIKADYLLKNSSLQIGYKNHFVFFAIQVGRDNECMVVPVDMPTDSVSPASLFSEQKDYSQCQKRYTLLCKEKIINADKTTEERNVLYIADSYKPMHEAAATKQ